jgi:hypothetical protein
MARALITLPCLLIAAGCAPEGPYPSLAPRPMEKALAEADIERPVPALPGDPAVARRAEELSREADLGQAEFEAALPAARSAAAAAGGPGGESWIAAQQALSRLEAARTTTTRALAELDAYAATEARARRLSPADLSRLSEAVRAVQALADRQHEQVAALQAKLGSP